MASDPQTLARVRRVLARKQDLVEKRMVGGGLGFMVKGKLCVCVGEARLLLRVDPDARLKLLKKPGARAMKMGGKTLKGFIFVEPPGYRTDTQLKGWIQQSLDVIAALAKLSKSRRSKPKRVSPRRKAAR